MSIYIILLDDIIKGYVPTEKVAKDLIHKLSEKLISDVKQLFTVPVRIFTEHTEIGVNIYSQELGRIINGPVVMSYSITYKEIIEYKGEN